MNTNEITLSERVANSIEDVACATYERMVCAAARVEVFAVEMTKVTPELNLYDKDWPIWTYQEQLPPAKFVHDLDGRRGEAINALVSGGCIVSGSTVRESVLFSNVLVRSYSVIEQAVVLPDVQINRHCRLKKVVIDRRCTIPEGLVIGEDAEADARRFHRTEGGVVLVTREMLDRL